uniref:Uncharacterized protein n=1 Tax=Oryza sativa subsp. japonica TaxID=39947 RepID=Q8H439_ORYSJ|nr:hypothetical protein [Oryza sativa Japonica Group]
MEMMRKMAATGGDSSATYSTRYRAGRGDDRHLASSRRPWSTSGSFILDALLFSASSLFCDWAEPRRP